MVRVRLRVGDREVPFLLTEGSTCRQAAAAMAHNSNCAPWWAFDYILAVEAPPPVIKMVADDTLVDGLSNQVLWLGWRTHR